MTNNELLAAISDMLDVKLRTELQPIKDGISELSGRVGALERRMDSLEHRMDSLEDRMDALEESVKCLRRDVDALTSGMGYPGLAVVEKQ